MEILASDLVDRMKYNVALGRIMELEQVNRELKFELKALYQIICERYEPTAQERAKRMGIYCD